MSAGAAAPVSRRERKKLQTRQALRAAALRLFAERGFDATTVQDITETADVAPRTFFLHFASKEEVLIGDAAETVAAFEDAVRARPADEAPFEAVRAAALDVLALDAMPEEELVLQARLLSEAPHLVGRVYEHYASFEASIARTVAERYGYDAVTDGYPRMLAACVMTAYRVGLPLWHARGGTEPVLAVVAGLLDLLEAGLPSHRPD